MSYKKIREIDYQIEYSKKKIDIMSQNNYFFSMLDKFAGNNISIEKEKIFKLNALREKELVKIKRAEELEKINKNYTNSKNNLQIKSTTSFNKNIANSYDEIEENSPSFIKKMYFIVLFLVFGYLILISFGYTSDQIEKGTYATIRIAIIIFEIGLFFGIFI